MNVVRRTIVGILSTIMLITLPLATWLQIGRSTIGQRDTAKSWFEKSGFYDRVVDSILENVKEEGEQQLSDDPKIREIAGAAFSPEFIRQNIETALDGTYAWLDGDTPRPEFNIDLAPARQQLADGLASYAAGRAAELPACTAAQLQEAEVQDLDILTTPCLPPGVDGSVATAKLRSDILSNDFLGQTTFTGDDLGIQKEHNDSTGVTNQDFERIQSGYTVAKTMPAILTLAAALSAVGIVFVSSTRPKGLRRAGFITLTVALILGVSYLGMQAGSKFLRERVIDASGNSSVSRELASGVVEAIGQDVTRLLGWYALVITVIGGVLVLSSVFMGRNKNQDREKSMTDSDSSGPKTDKRNVADPDTTRQSDTEQGRATKKEPPKIQL